METMDMITGGTWFKSLTEKVTLLKKTTSVGSMQLHYPGAWILIHMMPDRTR